MGGKIVIYASKGFMQTTLQAIEAIDPSGAPMSPRRGASGPISFRSFGVVGYVFSLHLGLS